MGSTTVMRLWPNLAIGSQAAGPAEAAAISERKRRRNIVRTGGWPGAPGACRLSTGRHRSPLPCLAPQPIRAGESQGLQSGKAARLDVGGCKRALGKNERQAQEDKRKCELVQSLPKLERRLQELQAAAEKKERAAKPFLVFAHRAGDEGPRNGRAFSAAWHGARLFPDNPLCPIPCFRSRIHPVHSRGVVIKGIDGLKSAVRPFGLNQPLIVVTQYDVKKGLPAVGLISTMSRAFATVKGLDYGT